MKSKLAIVVDDRESASAVSRALVSITLILGVPLLRARDAEESARLMVYAGRQMQNLITEGVPRAGARPKSKRHIQLHILQGLPGVGPVRARRLLEKYGSISVALSATVDELAQLPGIGKGVADKIRWAVNEPPPGYLNGPAKLVERAEAGEEIVIARVDKPAAKLVPLTKVGGRRRLGLLDGKFKIPDDFNALLTESVLRAFESKK